MKLAGLLSTSTLALLLGATALICAQDRLYAQDQRDEAKPQQQQEPRPEATRPAQDEPKAARPAEARPPEQSEDKPARSDDKSAKRQDNDKSAKQADRGGQANDKANDKVQRSAKGGGRIPDDKFHANFGRQHTFAVHTTREGGQPRFQYGGYSFTIIDVWPADWAYTDQCYIDYIDDEYFLIDLAHPGIRLAIVVVG